MSEVERNKGKLIPFSLTEEVAKLLVEASGGQQYDEYSSYLEQVEDDPTWYDENLHKVKGCWYTVDWEVKRDTDEYGFAEAEKNPDGSIDFHTMHYNGGGHWVEVVEHALEKIK